MDEDSLGRAYNRTEFLEQRRKMLQMWADYPDKLHDGVESIPIERSWGQWHQLTADDRQDAMTGRCGLSSPSVACP